MSLMWHRHSTTLHHGQAVIWCTSCTESATQRQTFSVSLQKPTEKERRRGDDCLVIGLRVGGRYQWRGGSTCTCIYIYTCIISALHHTDISPTPFQYQPFTVQYQPYTVQYRPYTVQYQPYTVQYRPYTIQISALHRSNIRCLTPFNISPTPFNISPTLFRYHPTPYL